MPPTSFSTLTNKKRRTVNKSWQQFCGVLKVLLDSIFLTQCARRAASRLSLRWQTDPHAQDARQRLPTEKVNQKQNVWPLGLLPGFGVWYLTCGLLFVPSEHLQLLLQVPDVKQLAKVITGCRQQPVPIQVPLHLHHCVLVGVAKERDASESLVTMVIYQP